MRADVLALAWALLKRRLRPLLRRMRLLHDEQSAAFDVISRDRRAWHNEPFYWDVAAETGEFTHIIKSEGVVLHEVRGAP